MDQIFMLQQLFEKAREKDRPLYVCSIDLKQAFDSVPREALWAVLHRYGISGKLALVIEALYRRTPNAVQVDGQYSDWFDTHTGVRQGDALSPHLFNIYIDAVAREAFEGIEGRVKFTYRINDRIVGYSANGTQPLLDLFFADDLAIIGEDVLDLQANVDRFHAAANRRGLVINAAKTKCYLSPGKTFRISMSIFGSMGNR